MNREIDIEDHVTDEPVDDLVTVSETGEDSPIRRERPRTEKGRLFEIELKSKRLKTLIKKLRTKYTHIEQLVTDVCDSRELVEDHKAWLTVYEDYLQTYTSFCDLAHDSSCENMFEDAYGLMKMYKEKMEGWITSTVSSRHSNSQVSRHHSMSSAAVSRSSSLSSARLKAEQKKAELDARMHAFQQKKKLELAQAQLKLEQEELELKTEMDVVDARSRVLDDFEHRSDSRMSRGDDKHHGDHGNVNTGTKCVQRDSIPDRQPSNDTGKSDDVQTEVKCVQTDSNLVSLYPNVSHIARGNDFRLSASSNEFVPKSVHNGNVYCHDDCVGYGYCLFRSYGEQHGNTGVSVDNQHVSLPSRIPVSTPYDCRPSMTADISTGRDLITDVVRHLRKPLFDMKKFDGNPIEYCKFIRQFRSTIEQNTEDDDERLNYLLQFTEKKPHEIVNGFSYLDAKVGYPAALKELHQRYGQDDVLAEAFVKKALDWPAIKQDNPTALDEFSIFLSECDYALTSLEAVKVLQYAENMKRLVSKLPYNYHDKWRNRVLHIKEASGTVQFSDFMYFVKMEAKKACDPTYGKDALKTLDQKATVGKKLTLKQRQSSPKVSFASSLSESNKSSETMSKADKSSTSQASCLYCVHYNTSHTLDACNSFSKMNYFDKVDFLRKKGLCFACLKRGHMSRDCRSRLTCSICSLHHPTVLHDDNWRRKAESDPNQTSVKGRTTSAYSSVASRLDQLTEAGEGDCTMAVIPVRVKLRDGINSICTYAFLDPGSNASFCTNSLMQKLGAMGRPMNITLDTMGETQTFETHAVNNLQICDLNMENTIDLPRIYTKEKMPISKDHIPTSKDIDHWPHLDDVTLPEIDSEIEMLIGNNIPDVYTPRQIRTGPRGSPHATKSLLGWIVWNVIRRDSTTTSGSNAISINRAEVKAITEKERLHQLDTMVRHSIDLEFPERQTDDRKEDSLEDKRFKDKAKSSIEMKEGHYYMNLPFKKEETHLPNNQSQAIQRLNYLKRKMKKDPKFREDYIAFMKQLFEKEYAEKVTEQDLPGILGRIWYLPHHGVYHPRKPNKLRVVFDCSASYLGTSLNNALLQGPDMTNNLLAVLLRFRQEKIAVMGDVEAMYHQVRVHAEDCDYLRFLWWPGGDINLEPKTYRMKVHLFGSVSSATCANYALQQTATDNTEKFDPEVSHGVKNNFYVDDYLASKDSEDHAITLIHETSAMCKMGGFNLTKWVSNSPAVLESIPIEDRSKEMKLIDLKQDILPKERALGVYWDTESDTFGFKMGERGVSCTRRGILSLSSSVYDPFGLTAPYVLIPKCILQELCKNGASWDEEISGKLLDRWNEWISQLYLLDSLKMDRCYKVKWLKAVSSCELHHFADASETGYGMVTYMRLIDEDGNIHCSFVIGKARVAPLKRITIPRMELTAATALVRMNAMLVRELDYTVGNSYYWTDSMSVLRYIANQTSRFHTFVANRLSVIHESSKIEQWRYINTQLNPADYASRGMSMKKLLETPQWINGPDFLSKTVDKWPCNADFLSADLNGDPEVKRVNVAVCEVDTYTAMDRLIDHFSDWTKLRKAAAWLMLAVTTFQEYVKKRHCENTKQEEIKTEVRTRGRKRKQMDRTSQAEQQYPSLSVKGVNDAEMALIRYVQKKHFAPEIESLKRKSVEARIARSSKLFKLDPFFKDGVLRIGGRLDRSPIAYEARHQIILPKESAVSLLILRKAHEQVGHLGKNAILSHVRQTYWIIGANSLIKKMISKCVVCRKHQGKPTTQKMASLPLERVTGNEAPFSKVGVDYFGPFEIKEGRRHVKRWGVLFTCMTVRAVHLEVAASLDTDSCISAIRRFIARRGPVTYIRSDNGTNFVGAERELREEMSKLDSQKMKNSLLNRGITWDFNPPAASNFGGMWERIIRLIRKVMYSLLHTQIIHLDDEGLHTLFCEIEAILNGRPISEMNNSPNDLDALTPNHLILFRGGENCPSGVFTKEDNFCKRRWRQLQYLADLFWKRWVKEYLPLLQQKQKWNIQKRNIAVDDLVLVMDSNPRNTWSLARVLEVVKDKKGLVRIVKLKTKSNTLNRPVNKLCLVLESSPEC